MLKKLFLILCVIALILLAACKQDTAPNDNTNSTPPSSIVDVGDKNTISGIELEEDVFDDSDIQSNSQNSSSSILSSTIPSEDTASNDDVSSDSTSSDVTSDDDTISDNNSSQDEVVVGEDGTITLPIDRFD